MHHPSQEDPVVGSSNTHSKAEPLRAGGGDGPPHRGNLLMGERLLLACQRKEGPSGDLLQPPGRSERKPQTREPRTALGSERPLGSWSCFSSQGKAARAAQDSRSPTPAGVWVRGSIPPMPESQAGGKGMQEQSGKTVQNINNTQLIPTGSILRERETETALASYPGRLLSN